MKNPEGNNHSDPVNEFILLGFPCTWEVQIFLFSFFSVIYVLTLTGNLCIICAVWWDHHLHSPMYILLANFSFLEMWYVTSTVPSMLANFLSETKTTSFSGCFLQKASLQRARKQFQVTGAYFSPSFFHTEVPV